ncbi:MAG: hypothetical protein HC765_15780, partial [Brachymonas sp.]|nr:hypothetical protein [Brachymonas sp.]
MNTLKETSVKLRNPQDAPRNNLNRRRCLLSGLAVLSSAAFSGAGATQLPVPQAQAWLDASRSREVPVLLRWPAGKPLGVVVHSHGLG